MSAVAIKLLTAEEFAKLPEPTDGSQLELDRGRIVKMPPAKGIHGVVCVNVGAELRHHVKKNQLGWVAGNDAGTVLSRKPDTVRGPDVAYYSKERVPAIPDGWFQVPPDLAVEVLSPGYRFSRLQRKLDQFIATGVRLIWVIDTEERTVTILQPGKDSEILEETDMLTGGDVLTGFSCAVTELFK